MKENTAINVLLKNWTRYTLYEHFNPFEIKYLTFKSVKSMNRILPLFALKVDCISIYYFSKNNFDWKLNLDSMKTLKYLHVQWSELQTDC